MTSAYITLWSQPQVEVERRLRNASSTLDHTASGQYASRGISRGDRVYVVATKRGELLLLGRLTVDRAVTQAEAERHFGHAVYDAPDHLLGTGTTLRLDRRVPEATARSIVRESGKPLGIDPGLYRVEVNSLRTTGRITPASAALFDLLLEDDVVVDADERIPEGDRKLVRHVSIERSNAVRARAIELHGTRCMGCNFCFTEHYGPLGSGFIEIHHLAPLGSLDARTLVNPATDVVVLCANCHRMVHRETPPVTLSDLRAVVAVAAGA